MNSIEDLISIIKQLGGKSSFDEICVKYQSNHKRVLFSNDKALLNDILKQNSNIFVCENDSVWRLVDIKHDIEHVKKESKQKTELSLDAEELLNKIFSCFDNAQYVNYNTTIKNGNWKGQKVFSIDIPSDGRVCDIIMNDKRFLIYSSKKMDFIDEKYYKHSEAIDEPRPHRYNVPRSQHSTGTVVLSVKDDFDVTYRGKERKEYLWNKKYNIEIWKIKNGRCRIYSKYELIYPLESESKAKKEQRPYRYIVDDSIKEVIVK